MGMGSSGLPSRPVWCWKVLGVDVKVVRMLVKIGLVPSPVMRFMSSFRAVQFHTCFI